MGKHHSNAICQIESRIYQCSHGGLYFFKIGMMRKQDEPEKWVLSKALVWRMTIEKKINWKVAQSMHVDLEMIWTNNVNKSCNLICPIFSDTDGICWHKDFFRTGQKGTKVQQCGLKRHWMNGWRSAVGAFGLRIFMMGWHVLFTVRLFWHLPLTRAAYKAVRKAANTCTEFPVSVHDNRYKAKSHSAHSQNNLINFY